MRIVIDLVILIGTLAPGISGPFCFLAAALYMGVIY